MDRSSGSSAAHVDFGMPDSSLVQAVNIASRQGQVRLAREGHWIVNDQYAADPTLIELVMTVVQQVRVVRPVSRLNFKEIRSDLETSGRRVELMLADGALFTFYAGGNATKTVSYFGNADLTQIVVMEIPGYSNYIAGIFELSHNQWRDRLLFRSGWRSLQSLSIDYRKGDDLRLAFDDRSFQVENVPVVDSTFLSGYVGQFQYFQLNDYLTPGKYPAYDSLVHTPPMAILTLEDIDTAMDRTLSVYQKLPGQQFYLLTNATGDMMVIDQSRMEKILARPTDFEVKN